MVKASQQGHSVSWYNTLLASETTQPPAFQPLYLLLLWKKKQ